MWFLSLVLFVAVAAGVGWLLAVRHWAVETPKEAVFAGWYRLNPPRSVSVGALQQRIMRAAVGARVVSVRGVALVPSTFEVALHPDDLDTIEGVRDWIAQELAEALTERAEHEGWQLNGRPVVAFRADPGRIPGRPDVRARHENRTAAVAPAPQDTVRATGPAVGWLRPLGDDDPVALTARTPVILGRGAAATIDLADGAISRRHCELQPTATGWVVVDLGSANGTKVNHQPVVGTVALAPGDLLELGGAVRFVAEGVDPATRVAPDTGTLAATRALS